MLCKAFEEKKVSKCHGATRRASTGTLLSPFQFGTEKVLNTIFLSGAWKIGSASCNSEKTANLSSAYSSSKRIMQQFLTKLDCMSECVLAAANGCNADVPRMIRLLHIMVI